MLMPLISVGYNVLIVTDGYEQEDIVDIFLGLIKVTNEQGANKQPIVRIAHFSIQAYLESDRILQQRPKEFAIHSDCTCKYRNSKHLSHIPVGINLSSGNLNGLEREDFPLIYFAIRIGFNIM